MEAETLALTDCTNMHDFIALLAPGMTVKIKLFGDCEGDRTADYVVTAIGESDHPDFTSRVFVRAAGQRKDREFLVWGYAPKTAAVLMTSDVLKISDAWIAV